MKNKFKPCPWCLSRRSHVHKYDGDVWRTCSDCHAATAAVSSVKLANLFWNQRAASPAADSQTSKDKGTKQ